MSDAGDAPFMSDTEGPILSSDDFGVGSASSGTVEWAALVVFVGIVVFCAVQAIVMPRRTFCAEKMATD